MLGYAGERAISGRSNTTKAIYTQARLLSRRLDASWFSWAIRVYRRAGFQQVDAFMNRTNGGDCAFLRMRFQLR